MHARDCEITNITDDITARIVTSRTHVWCAVCCRTADGDRPVLLGPALPQVPRLLPFGVLFACVWPVVIVTTVTTAALVRGGRGRALMISYACGCGCVRADERTKVRLFVKTKNFPYCAGLLMNWIALPGALVWAQSVMSCAPPCSEASGQSF